MLRLQSKLAGYNVHAPESFVCMVPTGFIFRLEFPNPICSSSHNSVSQLNEVNVQNLPVTCYRNFVLINAIENGDTSLTGALKSKSKQVRNLFLKHFCRTSLHPPKICKEDYTKFVPLITYCNSNFKWLCNKF